MRRAAISLRAVESSLKRLRTDWIDLYQLHQLDPLTPIEETLWALDDRITRRKVRYIGCSNLPAWQLVDADMTPASRGFRQFVCRQEEYSFLVCDINRELLPVMKRRCLGLLPCRPIAGGFLSDKYKRGWPLPEGTRFTTMKRIAHRFLTSANWDRLERLDALAKQSGGSLVDIAFGRLAPKPFIPRVIAGASIPEQIKANFKAVTCGLSTDEITAEEAILSNISEE